MGGEWRETTVGQLCDAGVVELQTGPFGSQLHASDYVAEGVPVVPTEAIRDRRIEHSVLPRVRPEKAMSLERHRLRLGDVLFARRGVQATGHVALVRAAEVGSLCGTGAIRLRINEGQTGLDAGFLSHAFANPASIAWFKHHAIGATMPNLNEGIIRAFPLCLPGIEQQREIARALDALEEKIELNRRLSQTLEATARALFKSWFVDFDPVRAKAEGRDTGLPMSSAQLFPHRFVDSELGSIPEGWSATTLGDLARTFGGRIQTGPFGSQLHASDYLSHGVPVVMPKNIQRGRVSTDDIARIGSEDAQRLDRHRLQRGDIVYSRRGDVERHALVSLRETGWLCGTGCLLVRLGDSFESPTFASLWLDMPETREWIVRHAIGATMPNLNVEILSRVPVVAPPHEVLAAFESLVGPFRQRREEASVESETLQQVRDRLLQRLLRGPSAVTV